MKSQGVSHTHASGHSAIGWDLGSEQNLKAADFAPARQARAGASEVRTEHLDALEAVVDFPLVNLRKVAPATTAKRGAAAAAAAPMKFSQWSNVIVSSAPVSNAPLTGSLSTENDSESSLRLSLSRVAPPDSVRDASL